MKKQINLAKITSFVLLVTISALILVAGTYAKYSSSASGTSATVIANWSFKVNDNDITILGDNEEIAFGLFDTILDSDGTSVEQNVANGLIAPGTSGSFEFVLENSSDVTASYNIDLSVDNDAIPIEFSADGETWEKELDKLILTDALARGETKNVTVKWRWPFDESTTDPALGGQTITVKASVTATQGGVVNNEQQPSNPEDETTEEESDILIANSEFVYGAYYDITKFDTTNKEKLTTGDYVKGKTADTLLVPQDIKIKVTDTDVSNYKVTLSYFKEDGTYTGRGGIVPMIDGELIIKASEIGGGPYFRISVYIYSPFTKIPETAEITVYKYVEKKEETTEQESNRSVLIANSEFVYGSYFDLNLSNNPNEDKNAKRTDGSYGLIKTSDVLIPAQDITIKVTDTDLSSYKVTLGYFDKDGNYTGRNQILSMTDGELSLKASEIGAAYFRVNVYKMPGGFEKVPETAKIVVYAGATLPNTEWQNKNVTIVGDSISTGGWTDLLGNMTGSTITNLSVSGTTLTTGISSKVASMEGEADLIIIFGGTNDYWHKGTNIGTAADTGTTSYYGALNTILSTLKSNYSTSEYLFVFPYDQYFGGNPSSYDHGKGTLNDFRTAFIEFCTNNNVNYVDLGATEFNYTNHTSDGVHPNSAGHQIIAQTIYDYITTY